MASIEPPPEAHLIARRRTELVPHLSQREAANRAGISPTRWRQLESGVIRVKGRDYRETAPAEALARMAQVVGASPAELEDCGRADAAVILRKLQDSHREPDPRVRQMIDSLSPWEREWVIARLTGQPDPPDPRREQRGGGAGRHRQAG